MQGAHALLHLLCVMLGIIPAYAGSTRRRYRKPRWSRDHPRVCGEHIAVTVIPVYLEGSSPRMRGAPVHVEVRQRTDGIIPAYAGSTFMAIPIGRLLWDHPRVCGEHFATHRG